MDTQRKISKRKSSKINIGEVWYGKELKEFIIDDIFFKDEEAWVSYHSVSTGTEYRCLADAFTHQFSKKEVSQT